MIRKRRYLTSRELTRRRLSRSGSLSAHYTIDSNTAQLSIVAQHSDMKGVVVIAFIEHISNDINFVESAHIARVGKERTGFPTLDIKTV